MQLIILPAPLFWLSSQYPREGTRAPPPTDGSLPEGLRCLDQQPDHPSTPTILCCEGSQLPPPLHPPLKPHPTLHIQACLSISLVSWTSCKLGVRTWGKSSMFPEQPQQQGWDGVGIWGYPPTAPPPHACSQGSKRTVAPPSQRQSPPRTSLRPPRPSLKEEATSSWCQLLPLQSEGHWATCSVRPRESVHAPSSLWTYTRPKDEKGWRSPFTRWMKMRKESPQKWSQWGRWLRSWQAPKQVLDSSHPCLMPPDPGTGCPQLKWENRILLRDLTGNGYSNNLLGTADCNWNTGNANNHLQIQHYFFASWWVFCVLQKWAELLDIFGSDMQLNL